ncbi:type II secretion system protein GspG [Streptomyces sp. NPDC088350]|uniref:type II secretion system protein GspG n=1 Tax=Streptomyces sp. NPDC088350 TaxID=3365854 RepID=UPI003830381B
MTVLENSTRSLNKATHSSVDLPEASQGMLSRAHEKAALLHALQLRPGEVDAVLETQRDVAAPGEVWEVARRFEPRAAGLLAPGAAEVADMDLGQLAAVGRAVLAHRTQELAAAGAAAAVAEPRAHAVRQTLVASASAAVGAFENAVKVAPIGMLHLERIEMAPAGIERGELLATIPLAPGEQTSVVHKEWSVTDEEFSTIVTDSLENYSEKGVTEKSELAEATTSQSKRNQQLGLDASLSGSYGMVTFAASTKFSTSLDTEQTVKDSRTHASQVTAKASARVRKERKVTIQSSTETGQQETTTRTLVNTTQQAMRVDYYSLMRKWRVRLLQYGLRLTYDLAIPEPGATLRAVFAQLQDLDTQIAQPFVFDLKARDITRDNFQDKAEFYGASVAPPPLAEEKRTIGGPVSGLPTKDDDEGWRLYQVEIDVPDGYRVDRVFIDALLGVTEGHGRTFVIIGIQPPLWPGSNSPGEYHMELPGFLYGRTGRQVISYMLQDVDVADVQFDITMVPTDETMAAWRFQAWQTLRDAARDHFSERVQALVLQREEIRAQLGDVDTLTLRQEEREEVMKGLLRWLLGPGFDFMPDDVRALFGAATGGVAFTGSEPGVDATGWATMFRYQEMVKFLQEAIEWENLLYFHYPYFWDHPQAWEFVRTIRHPDPIRQQFLRAGSARVVVTIRPGYEDAFAAFIDRGNFGDVLPPGHPYLTIGQEIRAYDQANYPGIPPANPETGYRPLLSPAQRRAWTDIQKIVDLLDKYHDAHGTYPTTAQGLAVLAPLGQVPLLDPWNKPYVYRSPGLRYDYEVSSLGANGQPGGDGDDADITSWAPASLIAEWYEYTASHGTDIQVNTSLPVMS